jgi:hypothetical protein
MGQHAPANADKLIRQAIFADVQAFRDAHDLPPLGLNRKPLTVEGIASFWQS